MHFAIASVPATKISDDGKTITLRVQDAQGALLDLEAQYTVLEDLANALNEASASAPRSMRAGKSVDQAIPFEGELRSLTGYRFAASDDKSQLLLELQTSTGRTDISLPMGMADEFVKEAQHHVELLRAPPRVN